MPRILIHCGHTFCTSCLRNFHKNNRVRCPMCLKLVKQIYSIDRLPINHTIFTKMADSYNKISKELGEVFWYKIILYFIILLRIKWIYNQHFTKSLKQVQKWKKRDNRDIKLRINNLPLIKTEFLLEEKRWVQELMKNQDWNGVSITKIELNIFYVLHIEKLAAEHAMKCFIIRMNATFLIYMKLKICMAF